MFKSIDQKIARYEEKLFKTIFSGQDAGFQIVGSDHRPFFHTPDPEFTLVIRDPKPVLRGLLLQDDYRIGKAFIDKHFDIDGDIISACRLKDDLVQTLSCPGKKADLIRLCVSLYGLCWIRDTHKSVTALIRTVKQEGLKPIFDFSKSGVQS
jgi:hypothetical protein